MGRADEVQPGVKTARFRGVHLARFRDLYGASPLHLLVLLSSFALAGYAAVAWFGLGFGAILRWFLIALVGHDLVLVPLYTLLDRIAFGRERRDLRGIKTAVSVVPYVRVPALLSGLLAIVYAPELLSLDHDYQALTGLGDGVYLGRWLVATGIMFALSAFTYAVALRRSRRRQFERYPDAEDPRPPRR
jgi:hypothetical protein